MCFNYEYYLNSATHSPCRAPLAARTFERSNTFLMREAEKKGRDATEVKECTTRTTERDITTRKREMRPRGFEIFAKNSVMTVVLVLILFLSFTRTPRVLQSTRRALFKRAE